MELNDDKYIILTGGAGFIGSCMLRHLNDRAKKNIILIDDLGKDEKWKNLVGKKFAEIIPIAETFNWLKNRESEIDAFIHLGACSSTLETDASYLYENNTRFSIRLAEYAITHGHRFIYASSAATYGDGELGFSDDHSRLEELRPLNMYGFSKHLFDLWVKDQNLLEKVVGLKYFNVFGPNEYHKGRMSSAITKMLPDAQKKGAISLFKSDKKNYGDGEQMRDFLYVKEAVRMTALFLTNDKSGIFNIGMGIPHSWNQLASAVQKSISTPSQIHYIDMPSDLVGKYQYYTAAIMDKFFQANPGFQFKYTLDQAVKDYVQNYLIPGMSW